MSVFRSAGMHGFSKQLAHTTILPSLGNKDLKLLQDLITAEKFVVSSTQRLADDFARASEALKQWGLGEGDDLGDVLTNSRELLIAISSALAQFATHEAAIRVHQKAVRTREEGLDELKRRRKQVGSKAESAEKKLSKMSPEHKQLPQQRDLLKQLQDEIRQLDSDIMVEEARLGDYKRQTTKDWMALKFGGLAELAQKALIVGNVGKQMIEEIPLDLTTPGMGRVQYIGHEQTQLLLADAQRSISEVVFQPTTGNLPHHYEPGQHHQPGPGPGPPPGAGSNTYGQGGPPFGMPQRQDSSFSGLPPPSHPEGPYPGGFGGEFGQHGPPPHMQAHTMSSASSAGSHGGGAYPPRTSSSRPDNRFATAPNNRMWASMENTPLDIPPRQEEFGAPVDQGPPSPAVPPKDQRQMPPFSGPGDSQPPSTRVSEEQRPPPARGHARESIRRSASGLSDTGADLVLAYYHSEEPDEEERQVAVDLPPIPHSNITPTRTNAGGPQPYSPGEDPYAADAYSTSSPSHTAPSREPLNLPPTQPLRPRSIQNLNEVRAADAAAAREIAKELDFSPAASPARPPPRSSSKGVIRNDGAGPYPEKHGVAPPPSLSLHFTDTRFDVPGISSPHDSPVRQQPSYPDNPRRSPPPSFEAATSQPVSPDLDRNVLPSVTYDRPSPAVSPAAGPPLPNPIERLPGSADVSRSASNLSTASNNSGASSLSTLPAPNAPFRSVSPSRGTTTSMPGSPTEPLTPKTITAGAFKSRFRAASTSPAAAASPEPSSSAARKRAPPLFESNPSYGSTTSAYVSAPSSPTVERPSIDSQTAPGYTPSPLSIPFNGSSQDLGPQQQQQQGHSRVSYLSTAGSPDQFDGDPHMIGVAMGSPSNSFGDNGFAGPPPNINSNRLTIGDQGWRPGMPARYSPGSEGSGDPPQGGYQGGRFATSLE